MSEARLIDGRASAARLRAELAATARAFKEEHDVVPGLRVVLVGEDPASQVYVNTKAKSANEVGIDADLIRLPAEASQAQLLDLIASLNHDPAVHGILVQLPLPGHIDATPVLHALDPAKDVDGFHPINVGRLFSIRGELPPDLLVPCTPMGCLILLRETLGELAGRHAVIVGRSNIVGKPLAALLLANDCTVTIAHSKTRDLPGECRRADILIAAVGRPEMVQGDWVKPGATVVDVGINRLPAEEGGRGRLVGDVAFAGASETAGAITPVPGGVGPMTVACVLRNTLIAARMGRRVSPGL